MKLVYILLCMWVAMYNSNKIQTTVNQVIYVVILFMRIMQVVVRAQKKELANIDDFTHVDWPGI